MKRLNFNSIKRNMQAVAKLRAKKSYVAHHMKVNNKSRGKTPLKVPVSSIYTFRNFRPPTDRDEQIALLREYVEWSFITASTNPIDFPLEKRINPHYFFKLKDEDPLFADMIEFVKYKFASQLEKFPVVSPQYTMNRIRYYDKEFGAWMYDQLMKSIQERTGIITVALPAIPNCESVPERNKDEFD